MEVKSCPRRITFYGQLDSINDEFGASNLALQPKPEGVDAESTISIVAALDELAAPGAA